MANANPANPASGSTNRKPAGEPIQGNAKPAKGKAAEKSNTRKIGTDGKLRITTR